MVKDLEGDEVFDDEDLSDGFDGTDEVFEDGDDELGGETSAEEPESEDDEEEIDTVEVPVVPGEEDDDLALDHDVELALDQVLAETMRLTTESDDDDDGAPEPEVLSENSDTVLPKQDDEFRCKSCRLLKKLSQLADKNKSLCRDCV